MLTALVGARVLAPDSPVEAASEQERLSAAFGEHLRAGAGG
jgi:hypothetical protein